MLLKCRIDMYVYYDYQSYYFVFVKKLLWVKRKEKDDYWCAGAYIINKEKLRETVDHIFSPIASIDSTFNNKTKLLYGASLVAAYQRPCYPKFCCNGSAVSLLPSCIRASRGIASDNFIFSLSFHDTYMMTIPLFSNSHTGNVSTVHQQHVEWHQSAFRRGRRIMKLFKLGNASIPTFANIQCMLRTEAYWNDSEAGSFDIETLNFL